MLSFLLLLLVGCETPPNKDTNSTGGGDSGNTNTQDTGSNLTCNTQNENCGPDVSTCRGEGGTMLPGADCISCHSQGNFPGREDVYFSIAGTIFTNKAGTAPLNNATIRVTDSTGNTVTLHSNSVGNFYSEQRVSPPLTAEVEVDGNVRSMGSSVDTGACNSCHQCEGSAGGKLAGPQ